MRVIESQFAGLARLGLLRYDGSGRVHRRHPDVLVSSSFSPFRLEPPVVQQMQRLPEEINRELPVVREMLRVSVWRRGADVEQEAASLALWV